MLILANHLDIYDLGRDGELSTDLFSWRGGGCVCRILAVLEGGIARLTGHGDIVTYIHVAIVRRLGQLFGKE